MPTYGPQPYGVGTPAVASAKAGLSLIDPTTGVQEGARYIDPRTGDYKINSAGRFVGVSKTKQMVALAASTDKGSAAMRELGHELKSIERISSNFARRVDATLRSAVQHLVDQGLIAVIGTTIQRVGPSLVLIHLQWRDLSTGKDDATPVNG